MITNLYIAVYIFIEKKKLTMSSPKISLKQGSETHLYLQFGSFIAMSPLQCILTHSASFNVQLLSSYRINIFLIVEF